MRDQERRAFRDGKRAVAVVVTCLAAHAAPAAAQGGASMGVSVVVGVAAPSPTITQSSRWYSRARGGATEMRSMLTVGSGTAYSLRIRATSPAGAEPVMVRMPDGSFASLESAGSALIASSQGSSQPRLLDLVVRLAANNDRAALTAELFTTPLDQ